MGWFSDFISDPLGTVGDTGQKIIDNPVPAITAAVTQNPAALLAYAAPQPSGMSQPQAANYFAGGTNLIGGLLQGRTDTAAAKALADQLRTAGTQAATGAQFRPVGTTTRFGTSAYSIDPATGGLKADYSLSPLAAGYQQSLADMTGQGLLQGQQLQGLASQYLGESPEAVRQRYVEQQTALLAPGQEQQLAGIRNRLFQTGRGGLATGATEAGGLAATNPEMAAYYNALANQQRQIAAGADQAAQQQIQFGQGLAGQAYNPFLAGFGAQGSVESAAQQPLTLAQEIAKLQAASGAQAGALGLRGSLAGAMAEQPANQYNAFADILRSPTFAQGVGSSLSGLGGLFSSVPSWTTGIDVIPNSTFGGYGDVSDLAQYGVF
jgi:hypothetical protein